MRIDYLSYITEISALKSISKVAINHHISQSSLSQQIQKMEDILDIKLLERSNKGVNLTEGGEIVLKNSEIILKSYTKMLNELKYLKENKTLISIDIYPYINELLLIPILYKSKNLFPKYEICLNSSFEKNVEYNIINNLCTFAISYESTDSKELSSYELGTDNLILVCENTFKINDIIDLKTLKNYPFILISSFFKICDLHNYLNISLTVNSLEAAKASVEQGLGITLLPKSYVKDLLDINKLKEINLVDFNSNIQLYLISRKQENKDLKEFIQLFKKEIRKILS